MDYGKNLEGIAQLEESGVRFQQGEFFRILKAKGNGLRNETLANGSNNLKSMDHLGSSES